MKKGQLCRVKFNPRISGKHGYLWVYTGYPRRARVWGHFTSVATGHTTAFDKALMEPADET